VDLAGAHLLVAFSGGLDSTVLSASLVQLAKGHNFRMTLAHVNHQLRAGAAADEEFSREAAAGWGVPFRSVSLNPGERGQESVEAWARRERYAALQQIAAEEGAHWILTAHHAGDQAETVLMRLMQQASLLSLAGIRPRLGRILRPLLDFVRKDLQEWAEANQVGWVEDPTNQDRQFLRNQLRHGILKDMAEHDPAIRETLLGLARLAQGYEASCVLAAGEVSQLVKVGPLPGTFSLPTEALEATEEDIARIVIRDSIARFMGYPRQITRHHWQNFRHFVRKGRVGKVFDLSSNVRVLRDRKLLVFYGPQHEARPEQLRLKPGKNSWGTHVFEVERVGEKAGSGPIVVRAWQHGDRYRPQGHKRGRLVSDIFIDAKLSRLEKMHWPIVADERDNVIWVPGLAGPRDQLQAPRWIIAWRR